MPNLRIIDYGFSFTGSTHDSTAWEKMRIFQEHETIFEEGDFIWGDSAYPSRTGTDSGGVEAAKNSTSDVREHTRRVEFGGTFQGNEPARQPQDFNLNLNDRTRTRHPPLRVPTSPAASSLIQFPPLSSSVPAVARRLDSRARQRRRLEIVETAVRTTSGLAIRESPAALSTSASAPTHRLGPRIGDAARTDDDDGIGAGYVLLPLLLLASFEPRSHPAPRTRSSVPPTPAPAAKRKTDPAISTSNEG
ncbi:hypothetical protein GALMADRAFT_141026 [Galerina marginata CBS 339.88]|uniref:DDE Tnp4 domain-containing protein n=1 Tax=Galerina marginata (strain CBS 339.88) TaxID=685588 RepID=A0A067SUQ1_GALM3|nr:hypothetical protein GALMADRAFT_141026 [Galerina marginata CBS 339.88]